jgi:hypothetical protein
MQETTPIIEQPPIQPGEVFVPERAIREVLKASKEERPAKLAEFKEKLKYQQVGLARVQDIMIDEIRSHPEESVDELFALATDLGEEFGMNDLQKKETRAVLERYEKQHEAIADILKKFPKEEDLFRALFNRMPKGKIEIIIGPASLFFKCHDFEDYLAVCFPLRGSGKKREHTEEERKEAQDSGAITVQLPAFPDLGYAITAENTAKLSLPGNIDTDSHQKFVHEEQHAIKNLFQKETSGQNYPLSQYMARERLLSAETKDEKRKIFEDFYRAFLIGAEEEAEDEMLAYYQDGRLERIYGELTKPEEKGGIYNFLEEPKQMDYLWTKFDDETRTLAKEVANRVLTEEYDQILNQGINALRTMESAGYAKEEIIALLTHEPLARWGKVVGRVLEK